MIRCVQETIKATYTSHVIKIKGHPAVGMIHKRISSDVSIMHTLRSYSRLVDRNNHLYLLYAHWTMTNKALYTTRYLSYTQSCVMVS